MKANPTSINVCMVEDRPGLRETVSSFLNRAAGFRCVGAYGSAEEALEEIPKQKPNVVLMDINLPGMSGIECVHALKKADPALQIIMLTIYENSDQVFQALSAGACGYLVKNTPPAKLLEAIREVQSGGSPMSTHIARKIVHSFQSAELSAPTAPASHALLSLREKEILELLAKGYAYKQIADALGIAMGTIFTHIRRIYEKLHVNCRTEAVLKYLGTSVGPGVNHTPQNNRRCF
jgi:DNA-binding NarL/FixJ family response regulator